MTDSSAPPPRYFFDGQLTHLLTLVALLVLVCLWADFDRLSQRELWGVDARVWFVVALAVPVLHQVFVWLAWRSELCFGTLTNVFGADAFSVYKTVFFVLFCARPVSLLLLTIADHDSFTLSVAARIVICGLLAVPAVYTGYSVVRYFGVSRASGADHFVASDRTLPMVTQGIFRWSSNAMYTYAFLFFWIIAIAGASWAGLLVAFFSHVYIWVHYLCTEKSDMAVIYGGSGCDLAH